MNIKDVIDKIPIVNLLPIFADLTQQLPKAWEKLPDEKKQEIITSLLLAGAKVAKEYGEK